MKTIPPSGICVVCVRLAVSSLAYGSTKTENEKGVRFFLLLCVCSLILPSVLQTSAHTKLNQTKLPEAEEERTEGSLPLSLSLSQGRRERVRFHFRLLYLCLSPSSVHCSFPPRFSPTFYSSPETREADGSLRRERTNCEWMCE